MSIDNNNLNKTGVTNDNINNINKLIKGFDVN